MADGILVINAGSSSIKFCLYSVQGSTLDTLARGQVEGIGVRPHFIARDGKGNKVAEQHWEDPTTPRQTLLGILLDWLDQHLGQGKLLAAGHRVVLGGQRYRTPVQVDANVLAYLRELIPLVPLHQPANLAPIEELAKLKPELPQVACFDTAFHTTNPRLSRLYGLPRELTEAGVLRYGFHGLSYEYIAGRLATLDECAARGRTVVAHLGSGASMCALVEGKSVASSMGFSALEGLVMGTRPGNLDPGVLLYLMQSRGMDVASLEKLLYKESGLLGVSGISNDLRDLQESDHPHAREAVALFVYRINRELGSLVAAAGGLDALVFTAGIGEHSASVRAAVCQQAAWLGIQLDEAANAQHAPCISTPESPVSVWVVPTDEELMIAQHTRQVAT